MNEKPPALQTNCQLFKMTSTKVNADVETEESDADNSGDRQRESTTRLVLQIFPTFILAGIGMILAGFVFEQAEKKLVQFEKVPELTILIQTLLGLKGNLEMTLASRLSTESNLGSFADSKTCNSIIWSNLVLIQVQAITVTTIASAITVTWTSIAFGNAQHFPDVALVFASALTTVCIAGLIIGAVTAELIVLAHYYKCNPDNIATPVAAGLGDLVTLLILVVITSLLFKASLFQSFRWLLYVVLLAVAGIFIPALLHSYKSKWTKGTLLDGWSPILASMCISSASGLVLKKAISLYPDIAFFLLVLNGAAGSLVSIHASRLSTELNRIDKILLQQSTIGTLQIADCGEQLAEGSMYSSRRKREAIRQRRAQPPPEATNLRKVFWGNAMETKASKLLLAVVPPGHVLLLTIASLFPHGDFTFTIPFIVLYILVATVQVAVLILISGSMTLLAWKRGRNPDNFCIPYLTALGDFSGTVMLFAVFAITTKKHK